MQVKNNGYTCIECKKRTEFSPSLKDRGMTPKQAQSIFVDSKGGRCTECMLISRDGNLHSDHSLIAKNVLDISLALVKI